MCEDEQTDGNIFGTKLNNNITVFGGFCHIVIESEVYIDVDDNDTQSKGSQAESNNDDHAIYYAYAIDKMENSREHFSKRYQLKVDKVRMSYHVVAFPS